MKTWLTFALLLALTGSALAQSVPTTCFELNTGVVPVGTMVDILGGTVVVTSVRYNGFSCTDLVAGPYTAIWVYTGGDPAVQIDDVVEILGGEYKEYYDLSEIDMTTFGGTWMVVGTTPAPCITKTAAELLADPEPWESHVITVCDGMTVISAPNSYGEWTAESYDSGAVLLHDDYFYDESQLAVGDCYMGEIGLWTYSFGTWRINPLAYGICIVDCTIPNETMSLGQVKSLYRH